MLNTNAKRKVGRPKNPPLTDKEKEEKRKDKNRKQREYYKNTITLNPTKIRQYTKYENQIRKKNKINKRQTLLQTKQRNIKTKSEEKIQGKNEK